MSQATGTEMIVAVFSLHFCVLHSVHQPHDIVKVVLVGLLLTVAVEVELSCLECVGGIFLN